MLNLRPQLAFGAAISAMVGVTAISYREIVAFPQTEQWAQHSHQVLETLQNFLVDITEIKAGYRDYVLTANKLSWTKPLRGSSLIRST